MAVFTWKRELGKDSWGHAIATYHTRYQGIVVGDYGRTSEQTIHITLRKSFDGFSIMFRIGGNWSSEFKAADGIKKLAEAKKIAEDLAIKGGSRHPAYLQQTAY